MKNLWFKIKVWMGACPQCAKLNTIGIWYPSHVGMCFDCWRN